MMKGGLAPDRSLTPTLSQRARERTCCADFIVRLAIGLIILGTLTLPASLSAGEASCSGNGLEARVPPGIRTIVQTLAPKYGLDPLLVYAVMATESAFRTRAVSHANAQGLMQLIPATAERFGVRDPFDPKQNIRGGMEYLQWLLKKFEGNLDHALAGYNAGEGAVMRYRGIPPYRETRAYVKKIRRLYNCGGGGSVNAENIRLASVFFGELEILGEGLDAVALDDVRGDAGLSTGAPLLPDALESHSSVAIPVFD